MNSSLVLSAVESAFDPVLVLDRKGHIRFASGGVERLTGLKAEALQGRALGSLMPARVHEFASRFLAEYSAAPRPRNIGAVHPLYFVLPDGSERRVEFGVNTFEHEGDLFAVCTVSERREAPAPEVQRVIERLESRLRSALADINIIIEHAPAAIAVLDRDMRYMLASRRWMEDLKLSGDIIGKSHYDLFPDIPEHWRDPHRRGLSGEIVRNDDDSFVGRDGQVEYLRWELLPWHDLEGAVGGITIFSEIITTRKLAELAMRKNHAILETRVVERTAQLERARDEALRASAAKTRFIAGVSHDLRQPLQAAAMLLSAIERRVAPAEAEICVKAEAAIFSAAEMLAGLLDASRLEEGVLQPRIESFDVDEVLARVARGHRPLAEAKGLELEVLGCSAKAASDPLLLARIVDNFIANAVKYTEHGKIIVGCTIEGKAARLYVKDTGIGLDGDALERVFDPYVQVDNPGGDASRGYGLGLAICRTVADALHCKLDVQSAPGEGATFSVVVPLAAAARGDAAA